MQLRLRLWLLLSLTLFPGEVFPLETARSRGKGEEPVQDDRAEPATLGIFQFFQR